jgi:hypothetical protein
VNGSGNGQRTRTTESNGLSLADIQAVKELTGRLGAENLRALIEVLA